MSIKKTEIEKGQGGWAIWEVGEMESELAFRAQEECPDEIINESKRLEWLAGRNLVRYLAEAMGEAYMGVHKDEYGKPFLRESSFQISLSHSYPYVAAQISARHPVGIDLEQPKEKLLHIAPRVLSPTELQDAGNNLTKHCVYWCAKEALYKIDGKKGLHFSNQLNVEPFELQEAGDLTGTISRFEKQMVHLAYVVDKEFVLVYTKKN
jgi:4'-phosphopantetheinyl transferase